MGYLLRDYRVGFNCEEIILENQVFCWNPSITGTKSEDGLLLLFIGLYFNSPRVLSCSGF